MKTAAIALILLLALFSCKEKSEDVVEKVYKSTVIDNMESRNHSIVQKAV
ncbi:hypothetical protein [Costertonia aggregata]|uniref:Uncharacterized protein n=1 Tax=Costertonia aggregata TaxID=343403 RepID=A0A7H9AQX6_9FLAO|nr:hypothetical protein [Costertonia aggregata]QLG45843.1 hypothetical protein HYG79_10950 [Costertonia aggregata]